MTPRAANTCLDRLLVPSSWLEMILEFLSRLFLFLLLHPSVWKEQMHNLMNKRTNALLPHSRLSHYIYMCLTYA